MPWTYDPSTTTKITSITIPHISLRRNSINELVQLNGCGFCGYAGDPADGGGASKASVAD